MIEYSIVISAYNEEASISMALTQVLSFMGTFSTAFEIIVVDDGSTDRTVEMTENYINSSDKKIIKLIKNSHKGKANGVRTGIFAAQGEYILFTDADMATPIDELKRLMVWIQDHNFDMVIGSREGIGAQRHNEPFIRHLMGRVFNLLVKIMLSLEFEDTQCGFKVMKKDVAKDIFSHLILFGEDIAETNKPRVTAFDSEALVVAKKRGYKVKAVPVNWTYTPSTRVRKIGESVDMFIEVLRIKVNSLAGKYSAR